MRTGVSTYVVGMVLEFRDPTRRRRFLLAALGVTLALVAGVAALSLGNRNAATPPPTPQKAVVIAARDIPSRTVLVADDLKVTQVPDVASYATAFTDPQALLGDVTTVPVIAGQVVYPNMLVSGASGGDFSILEPGELVTADSPYWRAVSVQVPRDRAVGGDIVAGQHVDLYVTVQIDVLTQNADGQYVDQPTADGLISGKSTKIVFQDLPVLKAQPDGDLYVLKVNAVQAEQIYHVAAVAPNSFSLALRPDGDTRQADVTNMGETNDRLIATYLFPIPQLIDLGGGIVGPPPPSSTPGPSGSPPPSSPAPTPSPAP